MTPPPVPQPRRSVIDGVAAAVFTALAALAALSSVGFSLFFVMATDSCDPDTCKGSRLAFAYIVTWGGVVGAAVLAVVGMVAAERRGKVLWIWPALALVVVAATFAGGAALATSVAR